MKPHFLATLLLVACAVVATHLPALAQARATSCAVVFTTPSCDGCDNKDHDTKIRVSVVGIYGYEVASAYYTTDEEFPDNGSVHYVPCAFSANHPVLRPEVDPVQKIIVTIEPNGSDDWVFTAQVVVTFSDGSTAVTDLNRGEQVALSSSHSQEVIWKR